MSRVPCDEARDGMCLGAGHAVQEHCYLVCLTGDVLSQESHAE